MSTARPDRRTILVGGLAFLAGCSAPDGLVASPAPGAPVVAPGWVSATPTPSPTRVVASPSALPTASATQSAKQTPQTLTFKAMTYNILTGARPASDFPHVKAHDSRFENRLPVLAEWIMDAAPHVLGIQENEPMRAPIHRPLRRLLPLLHGYLAVQADTNIPILYRADVFRAIESGIRVISRERHVRYGAWCRLQHLATGQQVLVANTHLDPHQSAAKVREKSLRVLTAWLAGVNARRDLPVMLLGDFNTPNKYDANRHLRGMAPVYAFGLLSAADITVKDASEVANATSFNGLGYKVDGKFRYGAIHQDGRTIDYIWVGPGFTVRSWEVYTGPDVRRSAGTAYVNGLVPSDHCPVLAEVTLH